MARLVSKDLKSLPSMKLLSVDLSLLHFVDLLLGAFSSPCIEMLVLCTAS